MRRPLAAPARDADPRGRRADREGWCWLSAPDSEHVTDFIARIHALTPRIWVTPLLVALTIGVFVWMAISGVHLLTPAGEDLVAWGANVGPLTTGGQWWRLLTSCFLHIGLMHIAFNMYVLWDVGRLVERLVGNLNFLALYVTSGIAGSLASVWWNPQVLSAGASGAVFGVFGALAGFLVRSHASIPRPMLRALVRSTAILVGFNVIFGFSVKGIDNAAHLGGLAAGFVCGLVLAQDLDARNHARRSLRGALVTALGLGLYFGAPALVSGSPLPALLMEVAPREQAILDRYNGLVKLAQQGQLADEDMADRIEQEILVPWASLRAEIDAVEAASDRDRAMQRYFKLREQGWRRLAEGLRAGSEDTIKAGMEKLQAADALVLQGR